MAKPYHVTCSKCPATIRNNKTGLCLPCYKAMLAGQAPSPAAEPVTLEAQLALDRDKQKAAAVLAEWKAKYQEAVKLIEQRDVELGWLADIRAGVDTTYRIEPKESSGTSEGTPIIVASDWHSEEIVRPAQVSGLNEFNLDIADRRITRFFQSSLNLIKNHLNPGIKIHNVVLALLGDFITNDIHDAENAESNALLPVDAIIWVQNRIIAGIDFLLDNSPYTFIVPCKVGNHSRTTKKTRFGSEAGHSLESLMYVHLAGYYRNEPRIKFVIDDGYHTYLDIYDQTIRFHHGHAIKYQGGIGGLFIPAYKAVSQWTKARHADLDIFGHFHQSKDGGNFICNGSLIGYNSFALSIKADYEPPKQQLILIDKKRGRTALWPILLEKKQ
jgi:hypothetical protein